MRRRGQSGAAACRLGGRQSTAAQGFRGLLVLFEAELTAEAGRCDLGQRHEAVAMYDFLAGL
jgi:hypothetical protein